MVFAWESAAGVQTIAVADACEYCSCCCIHTIQQAVGVVSALASLDIRQPHILLQTELPCDSRNNPPINSPKLNSSLVCARACVCVCVCVCVCACVCVFARARVRVCPWINDNGGVLPFMRRHMILSFLWPVPIWFGLKRTFFPPLPATEWGQGRTRCPCGQSSTTTSNFCKQSL